MTWQDLTFAGGTIVLAIALLPCVFGSSKPARLTSAVTALTLAAFLPAYASLGLLASGVATLIAVAL